MVGAYFRFLVYDNSEDVIPLEGSFEARCIDADGVGGCGPSPEAALEAARLSLARRYAEGGESIRIEPAELHVDTYAAICAGEPIDDLSCVAASHCFGRQ